MADDEIFFFIHHIDMRLKELDRRALVAWSPLTNHSQLFAAGSVAGMIDDDFADGAKIEIFRVDVAAAAAAAGKRSSSTAASSSSSYSSSSSSSIFGSAKKKGRAGGDSANLPIVGSTVVSERFSALAWGAPAPSATTSFSAGIIAGGFEDGSIGLWSADEIISG